MSEGFIRSARSGLYLPGRLFSNSATVTVATTAAETTLVPAGHGSLLLPPYFFDPLRCLGLSIEASGVYGTRALGAVATVKIKLGSTALATLVTTGLVGGVSGLTWNARALVQCYTSGASGTFRTRGSAAYETAAGTLKTETLADAGAVTIDTTVEQQLDITVQWDNSDAANTITTTNMLILAYY